MGNSNIELDSRLSQVERLLENYSSTIEPKSGEFVGQNWYNEATEVLNMWNGREFTPAYGNSIVQDLEGNKTLIQQNTDNILLRVEKTDILAEINLSTEGVFITGDRIQLNGDVDVQGSFSITSISDSGPLANKDYINTNDLGIYASTANGIYMTSTGIKGYYGGSQTINIDTTTGNAYFKGNIYAESGTFTGSITSSATISGGTIQSSDWDSNQGWLLDFNGMTFGFDKEIFMKPGAAINLGYGGAGPKINLQDGTITVYYSSLATPVTIKSDYNGTLIVNNNIEPNTNNLSNLGSSTYQWNNLYSRYIRLGDGNKLMQEDPITGGLVYNSRKIPEVTGTATTTDPGGVVKYVAVNIGGSIMNLVVKQ